MKKALLVSSLAVALLINSQAAFASQISVNNDLLVESDTTSQVNISELKKLQKQALELVQTGHENEIDNLHLAKKYKNIFENNPELYSKYVSSLDSFNKDKVKQKLSNSNVKNNEKNIIVMDDGSFIVIRNMVTPVETGNGNVSSLSTPIVAAGGSTGEQTYTAYEGQEFRNDAQFDVWGAYRAVNAHLVTNYKVYSTSITIVSVSAAGTQAWVPTSVTSSTSINSNNARDVVTHGDYIQTDWIVYNVTAGKTTTWGMDTFLSVKYAGSGSITFTAKSNWY